MGVLFGCGQGVVFVPEIDSGKLAPMNFAFLGGYEVPIVGSQEPLVVRMVILLYYYIH